eukprot:jgi/Ulvmu1/8270/UM041_0081.1
MPSSSKSTTVNGLYPNTNGGAEGVSKQQNQGQYQKSSAHTHARTSVLDRGQRASRSRCKRLAKPAFMTELVSLHQQMSLPLAERKAAVFRFIQAQINTNQLLTLEQLQGFCLLMGSCPNDIRVLAAGELIRLSMYISALKAVDGHAELTAAVIHAILLVIDENSRQSAEAAVKTWLWDDVDAAFVIRDLPLHSCCLHPYKTKLKASVCIDELFAVLKAQHRLLFQARISWLNSIITAQCGI